MGLGEYHRKRDFKKTPEPRGDEKKGAGRKGGGAFVIQKHAATRLHYDFRLELDGVLLSWAVPKGPSLDPADKRLAMQTEDHPLEYGSFEGIIPAGEYGGGTVVLWDHGIWEPLEDAHKGYRTGKLKFRLQGKKLSGAWMLVKTRGRDARDEGRAWLLIKERDQAVRSNREYSIVDARPESVVTGRTLEDIAAARDRVWHSNRGGGKGGEEKPQRARRTPAKRALAGAVAAPLPRLVKPQLATLVEEPPEGESWLHEMKFDGYRILARVDGDEVLLSSRNGKDWTGAFPSIETAARTLFAAGVNPAARRLRQALLDGEVAVVLPNGTTSFQALQNALGGQPEGALVYFAFDLLYLDGQDLREVTLEQRKEVLERLLSSAAAQRAPIRYSQHVIGAGREFFEQACRMGLEGIISKRRDRPFREGRGRDWLKMKCLSRQEFVIGGFTEPDGSRVGLGALLLGVHDAKGRLVFAGRVGTGFTDKVLRDLERRLKALRTETSPFAEKVPGLAAGRALWVRPELVAEVVFTEWTSDGRLRHPSFQGLREDKDPRQVVRERPKATAEVAEMKPPTEGRQTPTKSTRPAKAKKTRAAPVRRAAGPAAAAEVRVAGVRLTHPDRVLFSEQGVTKHGLALFYQEVADWILPHIVGRPLTLLRCPEGLGKDCFYMKHSGVYAPPDLRRVHIKEKTKTGEYLVVDTLAGLISLVQMGILEIHTWNSTADRLEEPDRVVLDLDPGPEVKWPRVIEAAREVKDRLQALGLRSFLKTTGGKGLHVVAPLGAGHGWDQCLSFSRAVAEAMERDAPRLYTTAMRKAGREQLILLDYLRNNRGSTSVAAYSTRARAGAPVSVPVAWDELLPSLKPDGITIATLPRRLKALRADPWAGYWKLRQKLPR